MLSTGYLNIIEILFDKNYAQNKIVKGKKDYEAWSNHLTSVLAQFMHVQRHRTKEKWYQDLIKGMMNSDLFRIHWEKAQAVSQLSEATNYFQETDVVPADTKLHLTFNLFTIPVQTDLRFEVEFYTPANLETFKYFEKK